ncbi:hypothetical protein WR25_24359 [Diploscapter pachys]|uniref:oleoyl-[acyl-carrier-protein] hydrolase n=1 Tax=Diploscapter pachys TaxID=2018661 RepID=A0A2A2JA82_9BILA|nr:hypothetical protein WR25_24359 [Diploscapter pachys]
MSKLFPITFDRYSIAFLSTAWRRIGSQECIDNGGVTDCSGTGMFVGLMEKEYQEMSQTKSILSMLGSMASVLSGRLNYVFDCYGPSLTVDTACSSSLVALDLAIGALLEGKCQQAVVAGVNLILSEQGQGVRANGNMLSVDGISASFDSRANGYGRSDGCACLLLEIVKPDQDYLCYINARNVNHCGRGVSLTSPNGASHQRLLSSMFRSSGIGKDSVDYWEAHGTGTSRGDPIEFNALSSVLNGMPIGSAKSLLGHNEAAAGVTGLLKLCLSLQHQSIPPQLHLQLLNREISPGSLYLPFVGQEEGIQLGGISSFGVSGTNAAAILSKTNNHDKEIWKEHRPIHNLYLLPLSAKSQNSLAEMEKHILLMLQTSDVSISKVAATLASCRKHFNHRTVLVVNRSGQIISRSTATVKENKPKKKIKLSISNSNIHPDILSVEMIQKIFMESDYQDMNSEMTSKLSHSFTEFIKQLCGEICISTVPSESLKLGESSLELRHQKSHSNNNLKIIHFRNFLCQWRHAHLFTGKVLGMGTAFEVANTVIGQITDAGMSIVNMGMNSITLPKAGWLNVEVQRNNDNSFGMTAKIDKDIWFNCGAVEHNDIHERSFDDNKFERMKSTINECDNFVFLEPYSPSSDNSTWLPSEHNLPTLVNDNQIRSDNIILSKVLIALSDVLVNDSSLSSSELSSRFDELGLDSVCSVEFLHRLSSVHFPSISVTLTDLFDYPTPLQLTERVEELLASTNEIGMESISENEEFGSYVSNENTESFFESNSSPTMSTPSRKISTEFDKSSSEYSSNEKNSPNFVKDIRQKIHSAVSDVISEEIDFEDDVNFHELGMDSLGAIDFVNRLNEKYFITEGRDFVTIGDIFDNPTILELSQHLAQKLGQRNMNDELANEQFEKESSNESCDQLNSTLKEAAMRDAYISVFYENKLALQEEFDVIWSYCKTKKEFLLKVKNERESVVTSSHFDTLQLNHSVRKLHIDLSDYEIKDSTNDIQLFEHLMKFCSTLLKQKCQFEVDVSSKPHRANAAARAFMKTIATEKYPKLRFAWNEKIQRANVKKSGKNISGTWLITGGLTGIGLEVAKMLSEQEDVEGVVLVGRRKPSEDTCRIIEKMRWRTKVFVINENICDEAKFSAAYQNLPFKITGVIHSAGCIRDASFERQTIESFIEVYRAKVIGLKLDHFIVMSSFTVLCGNFGQLNYAVANGLMEDEIRRRNSLGLSGGIIQWGNWLSIGMASTPQIRSFLQSKGLLGLATEEALSYLKSAVQHNINTIAVVKVDWNSFLTSRIDLPKDLLLNESIDQEQIMKMSPVDNGDKFSNEVQDAALTNLCSLLAMNIYFDDEKSLLENKQKTLHELENGKMYHAKPERDCISLIAKSMDEMKSKIANCTISDGKSVVQRKTVFLFSGQGAQYSMMGRQLSRVFPRFGQIFRNCLDTASSLMNSVNLYEIVNDPSKYDELHLTSRAQPIMFCFCHAIAELWKDFGVESDYFLGHSVGELVAGVQAGILSLEDGLRLVVERGRAMEAVRGKGAMLAISRETANLCANKFDVHEAAINSNRQVVLAGFKPELDRVRIFLSGLGYSSFYVNEQYPFHSPLITEQHLHDFRLVCRSIRFSKAAVPIVSNVTGKLIYAFSEDYLVQQIVSTVRFTDCIEHLRNLNVNCWLECGPSSMLCSFVNATILQSSNDKDKSSICILNSVSEKDDDLYCFLQSALELERLGHFFNWELLYCGPSSLEDGDGSREKLMNLPIKEEFILTNDQINLLKNHCVNGKPVVCATFQIYRICLWVQSKIEIQHPNVQLVLKNVRFTKTWNLNEDGNRYELQYNHDLSVEIHVGEKVVFTADVAWRTTPINDEKDLDPLCKADVQSFEADRFYNQLSSLGLQYSKEFQLIETGNKNPSYCECLLKESSIPWIEMDVSLHSILRVCLDEFSDRFYIPFTISQVYVNLQLINDKSMPERVAFSEKKSLNEKFLQLNCRLENSVNGNVLFEVSNGTAIAIKGKVSDLNNTSRDTQLNANEESDTNKINLIGYSVRTRNNCCNADSFWQALKSNFIDAQFGHRKCSNESNSYLMDYDVETWDPLYFGLTPTEAKFIDPQQRLLLMSVVEAGTMAGIAKFPPRTGVFVAAGHCDFENRIFAEAKKSIAQMGTGTSRASLAGRISHCFKLDGPSTVYDTACSSSFVALLEACEQLRRGTIECAIVGSVNLILHDMITDVLKCSNLLADKCRPFAADADGFVRGEAVCCVILCSSSSTLSIDPIVQLSGWAVNHNAGSSNALNVPNGRTEEECMKMAGGEMEDVHNIECHATGTQVGDGIELEAVSRMKMKNGKEVHVSSIKGLMGHCEASSGLVSLIAVIEQMKRGYSISQRKVDLTNRAIRNEQFIINFVGTEEKMDKCLINNFGLTGTNTSLLVQNVHPFVSELQISGRLYFLMTLSAKTQKALNKICNEFVQFVEQTHHPIELISAKTHRMEHFRFRAAIIYSYKRRIVWNSQLNSNITKSDENEELNKFIQLANDYCQGRNLDIPVEQDLKLKNLWKFHIPNTNVYEEVDCWPFERRKISEGKNNSNRASSVTEMFFERTLVKKQILNSAKQSPTIFCLNKTLNFGWVQPTPEDKLIKVHDSMFVYFINEGKEKEQFLEIIDHWKSLSDTGIFVLACKANSTMHTEWTALLKTLAAEKLRKYKFISFETETQLKAELSNSADIFEAIFYRRSVRHVERLVRIVQDNLKKTLTKIENAVITGGNSGIAQVMRGKLQPKRSLIFTRNVESKSDETNVKYVPYSENPTEYPRFGQNDCFIHCAGAVLNGRMEQMEMKRLEAVLEPKVSILNQLRPLVQSAPHLICISSAAAIFGSIGQSNYAFANGLMISHLEKLEMKNGMARKIRTIHLGPVEDAGMLSGEEMQPIRRQIEDGGWQMLCREDVEECLEYSSREIILFKGDFTRIAQLQPHLRLFLSELLPKNKQDMESKKTANEARSLKQIFFDITGIKICEDSRSTPFMDLGIDSLLLEQLRSNVNSSFQANLSIVDLFNCPTFEKLDTHLKQKVSLLSIDNHQILSRISTNKRNSIAIIGRSGMFSGGVNAEQFFQSLLDGKDLITRTDKFTAGFLPNSIVQHFDHKFFGVTHEEAQMVDPQIRLFVQSAYNALEMTKYVKQRSSLRIGCFAGAEPSTYRNRNSPNGLLHSMFNSSMHSHISTYTAHSLDLHGPALCIYSACSTALVAIIQACQALQQGHVDLAIAGAVSMVLEDEASTSQNDHLISPTGVCRPFDGKGDGIVQGSGIGCVILKKCDDAIRDNDALLAIIRSYGMSNDGQEKASYMAPNTRGQIDCIKEALGKLDREEVDRIKYVECHSTGTSVGDQVELEAVQSAYGNDKQLTVGSCKANIGHCFAASGFASVFKVIDMLKTKKIPPQINFQKLRGSHENIRVNRKIESLPTDALIAVSSFGIGGTNAHLIIEAVDSAIDENNIESSEDSPVTLCLSAGSEQSLQLQINEIAKYLRLDNVDLKIFCQTMHNYRETFPYRISVTGLNKDEILSRIRKVETRKSSPLSKQNVSFYFCPQGVEYHNVCKELLVNKNLKFSKSIQKLIQTTKTITGVDYEEIIYGNDSSQVENCLHSQLAVFIVCAAIVEQLANWGIEADVCIGHSVGEYCAAWYSGAISTEDAIKLLAFRSKLVHSTFSAKLIAVEGCPNEYSHFLTNFNVELCATLSPTLHCYTAGNSAEIDNLINSFKVHGIQFKELRTERGFHSSMMDPILSEFEDFTSKLNFKIGDKRWISSMDGQVRTSLDPNYCREHMRNPVDMKSAMDTLNSMNDIDLIIEIGPTGVLSRILQQRSYKLEHLSTVPSKSQASYHPSTLFDCRAHLWTLGYPVKFEQDDDNFQNDTNAPVYQFDRIKCWKSIRASEKDSNVESSFDIQSVIENQNSDKSQTDLILEVVQEQLGLKELAAADNFFANGGDSLSALEVVWKLNKLLSIQISSDDLFSHPTPQSLSEFIGNLLETEHIAHSSSRNQEVQAACGPLTNAQEQIFMQSEIAPGPQNNIIFYAKLPSTVCKSSIIKALEMLFEYQPSFRTSFTQEAEIQQLVCSMEECQNRIIHEDKSMCDQSNIHTILDEEKKITFDLSAQPFRIRFVQLGSSSILIFNLHHILIDGWSISLLAKKFAAFYEHCKSEVKLEVSKISSDALIKCALRDRDNNLEHQLKELAEKLAKKDPTALPVTQHSFSNASNFTKIEKILALSSNVISLSKKLSTTKYVIYLSAFLRAINRWISNKELFIGTAHSGRNETNHNLITYAMNSLLLSVDVESGESFDKTIRKVEVAVRGNRKYENMPYHLLAAQINQMNGKSGDLFQVYFNYRHNLDFPSVTIEGEQVEIEQISLNTFFPFSFTIDEIRDDTIRVLIEFDSAKYSQGMIKDIIHDFNNEVLEQPQEIHQLCGAKEEYPSISVTKMLLNQRIDGNVLVLDGKTQMNYGEFREAAYKRRNWLEQQVLIETGEAIKCDDVIVHEAEMNDIVGIVAILLTGAAFAPIDSTMSKETKTKLCKNLEPKFAMTRDKVQHNYQRRITNKPFSRNDPSDLCYVIHTSGSTGVPKGVAVDHSSLVSFICSATRQTMISQSTRVAHSVNLLFDVSIMNIFVSLVNSATLVLYDSLPSLVLSDFTRESTKNANFMFLTSAIFNSLNKMQLENLTHLDRLFVGGETVSDEVLQRVLQLGVDVTQIYGPTETCIWSLTNRCKMNAGEGSMIGEPMPNERVSIADGKREGKLIIGGEKVARGYCRTENQEAVAFNRSFTTSDIVRFESDQKKMRFVDRSEDILKIRGVLVNKRQIEKQIRNIEEKITEIHLLNKAETLICFIAPKCANVREIKAKLESKLSSWMLPNVFITIETLPKNSNGKLDKAAMMRIYDRHQMESVTERSIIQKRMRSLIEIKFEESVRSVIPLSDETLELSDSFFSLGGHSLLSARFAYSLSKRFQISIEISDIFNCPNLRTLMARVVEKLKTKLVNENNTSIIVKLREVQDAKFNVYVIHAIGGTIFPYHSLLRIFPKCVGIYGIEYDTSYSAKSLKELAAFYADAIYAHSGTTRPFLLGHSLGGILSREIACELEVYGIEIPFVVLIDSWLLSKGELNVDQIRKFAENVFTSLPNYESRIEGATRLARMLKDYESGHCDRRMILFKAKQIGEAAFRESVRPRMTDELARTMSCNGFERVASDVETHLIPGDHQTCLHLENLQSVQDALLSLFRDYF